MCGRYLIDEEAYSDILEILYRSGTLPAAGSAVKLPPAMKDAMLETMSDPVPEIVPGDISGLFPGAPAMVTNGEVFPTNIAAVITSEGPVAVKWGFPHWKNSSVIINARSETALEKQMFRKSLLERRCVVPSNGFFEWGSAAQGSEESSNFYNIQIGMYGSHENYNSCYSGRNRRGKKTKYLLRHSGESKLYMAGFFSTFRDTFTGNDYTAFVILTTAASESVSPLHERMPLILSPDECDDWLGSNSFMEFALMRPGPELEISRAA